jgi:hypothetical protein
MRGAVRQMRDWVSINPPGLSVVIRAAAFLGNNLIVDLVTDLYVSTTCDAML